MRTIAVVNQKGGCGKTTTAVNLAAALAAQQQNVLLLDLDPQAHATLGFGHDPDDLRQTVYEALTNPRVKLMDVLVPTRTERLMLAPASVILASADVELAQTAHREMIVGSALRSVRDRFDVCVIDCAPAFSLLTISALVSSSDVIVPVQLHYYSLEGLRRVLETIRLIRQRVHPQSAGNLNVLFTLVEDRTTLSRQIQAQMREIFGSLIFQTVIHNNVRLCEAPSAGESVLDYAPRSRGALEYRALAAEVLGRAPVVEACSSRCARRGIQKDLSALFNGLRMETSSAARDKTQAEPEAAATATCPNGNESDGEMGSEYDVPIGSDTQGDAAGEHQTAFSTAYSPAPAEPMSPPEEP